MIRGFVSILLLLIAIIIVAVIFVLANPFSTTEKEVSAPQRIQDTQNVINDYQQKSIERQKIEIE